MRRPSFALWKFICAMRVRRSRKAESNDCGEVPSPQYRLRVDEWRIFYDVAGGNVLIRGVVKKSDAADWLAQFGEP
jgi:hypothetical protein